MDDTLLERFERAIALLSSPGGDTVSPAGEDVSSAGVAAAEGGGCGGDGPVRAVSVLEDLQRQVAERSVFSSNEPLREISAASIPLLALEHHLARGWTLLPWASTSSSLPPPANAAPGTGPPAVAECGSPRVDPTSRRDNLLRACDLWTSFLRRLEGLEMLTSTEKRQLDDFEEILSSYRDGNGSASLGGALDGRAPTRPPPPMSRDEKITRFRVKQELVQQQKRLLSLRERRARIGAEDDDEMDGYDGDGLARSLATTALNVSKADALDELDGAVRELPMVCMMIQAQQQEQEHERYASDPYGRRHPQHSGGAAARTSPDDPRSRQPLQVTRVTKDAFGQLTVKREEIRSGVLRPGWNQPTLSLEELAEREVRDALEREERQRLSEAEAQRGPRRYDQLRKDGAEDDADVVDASAALDRKWDDWKDENPRGSGNKRGNVGDRNF
jgi:immunoglobulin-binding protein 1